MYNKPGPKPWPEESDAAVSEILRHSGSRIPGAALSCLAAQPSCLNALTASSRGSLDSCRFAQAAGAVRKLADKCGSVVSLSNHLARMESARMDREAVRQIRYVVEVFHRIGPYDAVVAASALAWLRNTIEKQPFEENVECELIAPALDGRIDLVEESNLPPCAAPFVDCFGTPLHAFYRALVAWPDYAEMVWSDLSGEVNSEAFQDASDNVVACALETGRSLPSRPCAADLQLECARLAPTLDSCLAASSGVSLIAAALRRMFIESEQAQNP